MQAVLTKALLFIAFWTIIDIAASARIHQTMTKKKEPMKPEAPKTCADKGYTMVDGYWYRMYMGKYKYWMTYEECKANCMSLDGWMLSIKSQERADNFAGTIFGFMPGSYWLGLYEWGPLQYKWCNDEMIHVEVIDNSTATYTDDYGEPTYGNWHLEPAMPGFTATDVFDMDGPDDKECTAIATASLFGIVWGEAHCEEYHGCICECFEE